MESQISKLKLNLEQKDGDIENRYKRGSDAVEQQLREERNNLELEIRRLKVNKIKSTSRCIISRVGKGNLVLRHSVPHFPPNSSAIAS